MKPVSTYLAVCLMLLCAAVAASQTMRPVATHNLNYRGGERYPHLARIAGRPDMLSQILKSRTPRVGASN